MKEKMKVNSSVSKFNWDLLGFLASALCAVHCAFLPLIIAAFPIIGVSLSHNHEFETILIIGSLVIAFVALGLGYQNQHGSLMPLAIFSLSLLAFVYSYFLDHHSTLGQTLHFIGGATLLFAHVLNLYFIRSNPNKSEKECRKFFHLFH